MKGNVFFVNVKIVWLRKKKKVDNFLNVNEMEDFFIWICLLEEVNKVE